MDSSLVAIDPVTGKELWSDARFQIVQAHLILSPDTEVNESSFSADGSRVALLQGDNRAGRDDIDYSIPNIIAVLDSHTGKAIQRVQMGEPMSFVQITPDGRRAIAFGQGYSNVMFVVDIDSGVTRRIELPEKGSYARLLSSDQGSVWIAGDNLYKVSLDTLDVVRVANRQFLALALRQEGGLYAGTLDGAVVALDVSGHVIKSVSIADGLAPGDIDETMAILRAAPIIGDNNYEPHTVPAKISLPSEYPGRYYNYVNGILAVRGDNVLPLQVAVKITEKGAYRFTVSLANAKTDKVGMLSLAFSNGGPTAIMRPVDNDKLRQSADIDLTPGTYLITVTTANMAEWSGYVNFDTMEIVKAGK